MYKLLTVNNPKTIKGFQKYNNILTAIMHLRPVSTRICPYQDIAGCKTACLNTVVEIVTGKPLYSLWIIDCK